MGIRKNDSGSIGYSRRVSTAKNTARSTAARANEPRITPSVHPRAFPSIRAYTRKNTPAVPVTRPGGSRRLDLVGSRDSRTTSRVRVSPTAPTGTLMKKMLCQLTCSTSKPPSTGPTATASPDMAAQIPIAAPRSRPWKVAVMMESEPGRSMAAPRPCSALKAISSVVDPDSPHRKDPVMNSSSPLMKKRLRP